MSCKFNDCAIQHLEFYTEHGNLLQERYTLFPRNLVHRGESALLVDAIVQIRLH
jgi:hypothetical protein